MPVLSSKGDEEKILHKKRVTFLTGLQAQFFFLKKRLAEEIRHALKKFIRLQTTAFSRTCRVVSLAF